jgi:ferrous iron transport protein B
MWDKTWQYLKKIGGVILIGVIIIWALGYFPRQTEETQLIETQIESLYPNPSAKNKGHLHQLELEKEAIRLQNSYLGKIGKFIEPVMRPLGFDWKMSVALLAGLPAKEIVVSTMGVLYQADNEDGSVGLTKKLQQEKYQAGPKKGQLVISTPVALAFLIFILIYFPCIGVIATIKNESGKLFWAVFTMVYTTMLAWIMAFLTLHVARFIF